MLVYVLNKHGRQLMPTTPVKARILLKNGKARVVKRTPFTIQLIYGSSGYTQPVSLGMDAGSENVGLSAVSSKKELFAAQAQLRTDIVRLLSEKRQYRRTRRNRLWYRKPRFLNRAKPAGWLAPIIQHKLDSHIKLIQKAKSILPITNINIEVGAFDIQKIKNPDISGTDYQNGDQKGFWNVREYVLYRDGHKCQHCGKANVPLEVHHIESRKTGGNRPDNLITLCDKCHSDYHKGKIKLNIKKQRGFRDAAFMSTVRWKLVNKIKELFGSITVNATYGYITKSNRIELGLPKSHINDAFCIAGGTNQTRLDKQYFIKFVRRTNRSKYKANLLKGGKRKVNTIKQAFGFHRFDKVLYKGIECFIHALRSSGFFDIRRLTGEKVGDSVKYTKLKLIETAKACLLYTSPSPRD